MRVIAGSAKGRRLASLPGEGIRPITDRVKEALFGILAETIQQARVLDLFAGTGAVGIEALSRGAEQATFVESSPRALAVIHENLRRSGLEDRARVVRADVFRFLRHQPEASFDFIYVAPPQYHGLWADTLHALDDSPWLAEGGLVVAQIHPKEYQDLPLEHLTLTDQRRYGSTMLCFYNLADASRSYVKRG
jgi:16S rRNA (guanine966-N2)-methyltransferase